MNRDELMRFFLEEADEQLQLLEQEVLRLEQDGGAEATIQCIFRAAHTLKGSSAAMGFETMKNLTHEMENVLDQIRGGKLGVDKSIINVLFLCLDQLNDFKKQIEDRGDCEGDTGPLVEQLKKLIGGDKQTQAPQSVQTSAQDLFGQKERDLLEEAKAEGFRGWTVRLLISESCEMKMARAFILRNRMEECVKVVAMHPGLEEIDEEAMGPLEVTYLIACLKERVDIEDHLALVMKDEPVEGFELLDEHLKQPGRTETSASSEELKFAGNQASPEEESLSVSTAPAISGSAKSEGDEPRRVTGQSVRVDVDRLENLMNLVGELVIDQTRIAQVGGLLRDLVSSDADDTMDEFDSIANHISRVVGELQESVMKTRMLPIEQLFNRFPRMIRDLAQKIDKPINLLLEGKETELDRTVIEEIGDPLIHLLRNSADHGIEGRGKRLASGKPEVGMIRLKAAHQENQVVLTIEDDGGGIDAEKIKQSALSKKLITETQAAQMSEQELIHLIFAPGFSTAKEISDVSGRGVGMDIVRSHIEKLNGIIDVETKLGEGTKFTIKLPLTLAIMRGLLIRIHHSTYALPISSVAEIMRLPRKEIHSIKGQMAVRIREQVLPLVWIHDHFNVPRPAVRSDDNVFIVIVGAAEKRIALVVDELVGNQEIVVKSMGSYVGKVDGVSGATILGDGGVALILDITGIFSLLSRDKGLPHDSLAV
ncbi:chemotaxis protein CheA [Saccharibacillus kuerlensis]|uniref:Chemotaxis protein CheA n=1 Tax=Saccharibacillus kuerlensis TaxID=459527 RepID=A0ABQ2L3W1_9BACL|nr:chemotaxis protein CheA [Saccharibacillus kuerlensis]GGO01597.1 chemotaxis protein CheA [Saccharibacillus kuerlensis]